MAEGYERPRILLSCCFGESVARDLMVFPTLCYPFREVLNRRLQLASQ